MESQAWATLLSVCFTYAQAFGAGAGNQEATPVGRLYSTVAEGLGLEMELGLCGCLHVSYLCSLARYQFLTWSSQHVLGRVPWGLMR